MLQKKVEKLLDKSFSDVGRTGMIFEGFGVDHVHPKLFLMHGTRIRDWKPMTSKQTKFFKKYESYISSHDITCCKVERTMRRIKG